MEPPDKGRRQRRPGSHSGVDQTKERQADRDGGLFDTILQLLCCKEARFPLTALTQLVGAGMSSSDQQNLGERIKKKVLEFPNLFGLDVQGGNVVVTLQCDLSLCQAYCSKTGCSIGNCDALHLCRHFVISGKCTYEDETKGTTCRFGHDPTTGHNAAVLRVRMLSSLSIHQIRVLLKVTDVGIARASVDGRPTPQAQGPNRGPGNPIGTGPNSGPGNGPNQGPRNPNGKGPNQGPSNPKGKGPNQGPGNPKGKGPNQGPGNPKSKGPGQGTVNPKSKGPGQGAVNPKGKGPDQGPGNYMGMNPNQGPGNHMGMGPNQGPGNHMGMGPSQGPGNHMGMGPNQGPGNHMGMGPNGGPGSLMGMGPNQGPGNHMGMGQNQWPGNHMGIGPNQGPGNHMSMGPNQGPGNHMGMGPNQGPGNHMGMGPNGGPGNHMGMGPNQGPGNHMGMGQNQGPGNHMGMGPNQGPGNHMSMGPRRGSGDGPNRGPGNPKGKGPNQGTGNPRGRSRSRGPGNHMAMSLSQEPGNSMTTLEIPELCIHYISRGCRLGDKCKSLHVCKYYLYGNCSFGKECKRSHNISDDQPKRVLQEAGINVARKPKAILAELRPRLPPMHVKDQDDQPSSSSADRRRTDSDGSSNQDGLDLDSPDLKICQYFLRGTCSFKGRCKNLHRKTQFQWQYMANGAWEDFCAKSNTEIELNFCDVSKDCCYTEMAADPGTSKKSSAKVDFEAALVTTLSGVKFPVHRVTTESAVKLPPGHKFVTRWLWFWQDDDDTWKQYGKNGESLSSDDIEEQFLEDENSNITFETTLFNYMIQFRPRMVQINRKTEKARAIRRRPEELYTGSETSSTQNRSSRQTKSEVREKQEGKSEIQKKEDSKTETSESQPAVNIPPHWDMDGQGDNDFFKLTTLEKTGVTCFEYKKIERLFAATMGSTPIKEIQRIQNLDLWESYCWKKGRMERALPAGQLVTELQLFHGTRKEFVDAICQQGFDFRYCGRSVGTLYGRGSYFAVKASYSKNYTDSRCLFIAKVLVGASSQGNAALVRPPAKDPSTPNKLFDSCVDNVSDASIYVVFSNEQAYPEYKITY